MKIILTTVLGLLLAVPGLAQTGQQPTRDQRAGQSGQKPSRATAMATSCEEMMKQHQQMMSDMQQMNQQLQAKVSAMNSATGDQKIQAIADTVNELAKQHQAMFTRMQQMRSRVMNHMSEHMQSGGAQAMANCPMMKQTDQTGGRAQQEKGTKSPTGKSKAE